jgi:hypothetical protein
MTGTDTSLPAGHRDRLERHVRAIALPGGRRVGQPGHALAEDYLLQALAGSGVEPFRGESLALPYERNGRRFTNLVGRVRGREASEAPILIGAHYDSIIDAPCADDNAAAVAIALAAARALKARSHRRDVIVALFDAEEPPWFLGPAMGSVRFVEDHARGLDLACAIIMDLVGHDVEAMDGLEGIIPEIASLLFVMGSESHPRFPAAVRAAADHSGGLRVVPALHAYVGDMSDHHAFRLAGQPFLFLSCGQGRYYHLPEDTPDRVSFGKVALVLQFLVDLAARLDEPEMAGGTSADTVEFEIEMLEKALGRPRRELAAWVGLESLETRADLNHIAAVLSAALRVWAR